MLCLKNKSNTEWIINAKNNLISILIDHAHCEKKAALTGMNLINGYPEKTEIALAMADLVEEEIDHFRSVVKILSERNVTLTADPGDEYVRKLFSKLRKTQPYRLLDHLLIAGIIEARSCERLQILSEFLEDEKLKNFYTTLSRSEAGHYVAFVKLAKLYFKENEVKERLEELTNYEAEVVFNLPNLPLMHG